jgi:hypothetical protein
VGYTDSSNIAAYSTYAWTDGGTVPVSLESVDPRQIYEQATYNHEPEPLHAEAAFLGPNLQSPEFLASTPSSYPNYTQDASL